MKQKFTKYKVTFEGTIEVDASKTKMKRELSTYPWKWITQLDNLKVEVSPFTTEKVKTK